MSGEQPARVIVHTGGPRSGRAQHLERLVAQAWGHAVLIVPTRAAARQRLERVVRVHGLSGCRKPAVVDFKSFTESILLRAGEQPHTANDLRRRMVLEAALRQLHATGEITDLPDVAQAPGLVAHLLEVITQLKQAALEPEAFRQQLQDADTLTPLDAMTAAVYDAYQQALIAANLYDVPGLYWRAHVLATERRPIALDSIDTLLFDGFDDFTPSEFRLVTALAAHVQRVVFGLAYDPKSPRSDVHAQALATHARIRKALNATDAEHESLPCASLSEFAADNIFWRDRPQGCASLEANLSITPCIDSQHEAFTVMRGARALLLAGVPAPRIAIVYRNVAATAHWLQMAAEEFSVPVQMHHAAPLSTSAAAAFLVNVLHATDRWEREAVAEVLTSPLLAQFDPAMPLLESIAHVARRALVLEGSAQWLDRLDVYAKHTRDPEEAAIAGAGRTVVERLLDLVTPHSDSATMARFCVVADELIDALRVPQALAEWADAEGEEARAALVAVRALLVSLSELGQETVTRQDFARTLEQALRETPGPPAQARGGVHCLDATMARHLDFDYVYFAGLNEGAVPQAPAMNAIYNEHERARLVASGVELERRHERAAREMALYHHILSLPRKGLALSYVLNAGGREAAPSPFLVQTMELFAERAEVIQCPPLADAFLPPLDAAASTREVRNRAFEIGGGELEAHFPEALCGARVERARFVDKDFGPHDGAVVGDAARAVLMARFGPAHVFSVAQVESYAACPFQFFVRRALRIEEEDAPEAEMDSRLRGEILHRILHLFHAHFVGRAVAEIPEAEAAAVLPEFLTQAFDEKAWKAQAAPAGILHAEKERMQLLLSRHLAWARDAHGDAWKPARFELAFGPAREDDARVSLQPPFEMILPSGVALFSGRIDRVDEAEGLLRLIDYKTGGVPTAGDIKSGISLQLGVYALACEESLLPDSECAEAYFIRVGKAEDRCALGGKKFDRAEYDAMLKGQIDRCLRGIRAGVFPPLPQARVCHGCTTAHICRHEKARIDRKDPPALFAAAAMQADEAPDEL